MSFQSLTLFPMRNSPFPFFFVCPPVPRQFLSFFKLYFENFKLKLLRFLAAFLINTVSGVPRKQRRVCGRRRIEEAGQWPSVLTLPLLLSRTDEPPSSVNGFPSHASFCSSELEQLLLLWNKPYN